MYNSKFKPGDKVQINSVYKLGDKSKIEGKVFTVKYPPASSTSLFDCWDENKKIYSFSEREVCHYNGTVSRLYSSGDIVKICSGPKNLIGMIGEVKGFSENTNRYDIFVNDDVYLFGECEIAMAPNNAQVTSKPKSATPITASSKPLRDKNGRFAKKEVKKELQIGSKVRIKSGSPFCKNLGGKTGTVIKTSESRYGYRVEFDEPKVFNGPFGNTYPFYEHELELI